MPPKFEHRGHVSFPIDVDGQVLYDEVLAPKLFWNNQDFGGYYPIGGNQMWHGGIHLSAAAGTPVRAIAPGRIVAARLDPYDLEVNLFGSNRFVLVEHAFKLLTNPTQKTPDSWSSRQVKFFSLYMHLDWPADGAGIPWLHNYLAFADETYDADEMRRVCVARHPAPNHARRTGSDVFDARKGSYRGHLPAGTLVEKTGSRTSHWEQVRAPALGLSEVWIDDTRFDGVDPLQKGAVKANLEALKGSGCVKLDIPVETGEVIAHVGPITPRKDPSGARVTGFHLEVFSEQNDLIAADDQDDWIHLEDTDPNCVAESDKLEGKVSDVELAKKLKELTWDTSQSASYREALHYYKNELTEAQREVLRSMVLRAASFWSTDFDQVVEDNAEWAARFKFEGEKLAAAKTYMWWDDCVAAGVDLPAKTEDVELVYHYHPLQIMGYIHAHLPALPLFYKREGDTTEKVVVRGKGQIQFSAANWGKGDHVWVYDPPGPDWILGVATTYEGLKLGIGDVGEPLLHPLLVDEELKARTPGLPPLSDRDSRVWASIWRSEGGLNARNSYDTAYLSFGPFQQTMGVKNQKGELQGGLHAAFLGSEDWQRWFEPHGLTVANMETIHSVQKGDVVLDGAVRSSDSERTPLRDFIYAYAHCKADEDPEFRRAFMAHGFKRLELMQDITGSSRGKTLRLGDVYKTDLALALLLDWHINHPKWFYDDSDCKWLRAAEAVITEGDIDPATITVQQEIDMITQVLDQRIGRMNGDRWRAAYILVCTRGFDGSDSDTWSTMAQKFGFDGWSAAADPDQKYLKTWFVIKPSSYGGVMHDILDCERPGAPKPPAAEEPDAEEAPAAEEG